MTSISYKKTNYTCTNVKQLYNLLVMNFPHGKMFVSNDLTKGFQTKSAVKKCYLSRKKFIFSSTREIQKKTEEKLSASLVCISLMRICSFITLMNKIIYSVQTLPQL